MHISPSSCLSIYFFLFISHVFHIRLSLSLNFASFISSLLFITSLLFVTFHHRLFISCLCIALSFIYFSLSVCIFLVYSYLSLSLSWLLLSSCLFTFFNTIYFSPYVISSLFAYIYLVFVSFLSFYRSLCFYLPRIFIAQGWRKKGKGFFIFLFPLLWFDHFSCTMHIPMNSRPFTLRGCCMTLNKNVKIWIIFALWTLLKIYYHQINK